MRIRMCIVLLLLLLPMSAPSRARAANTQSAAKPPVLELESYENKESGIALKRPKAWRSTGPIGSMAAMFVHLVDDGRHKTEDAIVVSSVHSHAIVPTAEPRLSDVADKEIELLKVSFDDLKLVENKESKLGGEPARDILFTATLAGDDVKSRTVVCLVGPKLYTVQFIAARGRYEQLAGTFDAVVDSFSFTEKPK